MIILTIIAGREFRYWRIFIQNLVLNVINFSNEIWGLDDKKGAPPGGVMYSTGSYELKNGSRMWL